MSGRWFNERRVGAELYEGNRKRSLPPEVEEERQGRLIPPPAPPPAPVSSNSVAGGLPSTAAEDATSAASSKAAVMSAEEASFYTATATPAPTPAPVIPPQTYVKLKGLKNAAERNGQVGVLQKFDVSSGRWPLKPFARPYPFHCMHLPGLA